MEKSTPNRKLEVIKTLIKAGRVRATQSSVIGAAALGFDFAEMIAIILALKPQIISREMPDVAVVNQDCAIRGLIKALHQFGERALA